MEPNHNPNERLGDCNEKGFLCELITCKIAFPLNPLHQLSPTQGTKPRATTIVV